MITKTLLVVNGLIELGVRVKINHKETGGFVEPQILNYNNFNNVLLRRSTRINNERRLL
jgi:hypothetical protein